MKKLLVILLAGCSFFVFGQKNEFSISGKVTDCKTHGLIMNVQLRLIGDDGSSVQVMTDSAGHYFFDNTKVKKKREYVLTSSVTKTSIIVGSKNNRGYVGSSDKYKFNTLDTAGKAFEFNFCFVKGGCMMRSPCVNFSKNSFSKYIIDSTFMDINMFYQFMLDNPNLVFEIAGHASKEEKKPEVLAKKRAITIQDILLQKGIEPERLLVRSYSNTKPYEIIDEDTWERTVADKSNEDSYKLNRRVIISIVRKDYVSPNTQKETIKKVPTEDEESK